MGIDFMCEVREHGSGDAWIIEGVFGVWVLKDEWWLSIRRV